MACTSVTWILDAITYVHVQSKYTQAKYTTVAKKWTVKVELELPNKSKGSPPHLGYA